MMTRKWKLAGALALLLVSLTLNSYWAMWRLRPGLSQAEVITNSVGSALICGTLMGLAVYGLAALRRKTE